MTNVLLREPMRLELHSRRKGIESSAEDFEGAGRRRGRAEIGVEAKVQFGGFGDAALVPGGSKTTSTFTSRTSGSAASLRSTSALITSDMLQPGAADWF